MLPPPLPPDPNEWPAPDERELAAGLAGAIQGIIRHQFERGPNPEHALRDAHAKTVGLVRATLTVTTDDEALCHGVLRPGATYKAWVRFSNGEGSLRSDGNKDARGMAIKLCGVDGERLPGDSEAATQDIVMIDYPVFFVRNARDYLEFVRLKAVGKERQFFMPVLWQPWGWRCRELWTSLRIQRNPPSVLAQTYHSMTPYRLGPHVVKWAARPVGPVAARTGDGFDSLAEALQAQLADKPATYELCVQRRRDTGLLVEDASAPWPESQAPLEPVARLVIAAKQPCAAPERYLLADRLSFSPWHCLAAHRPLGSLNRMRRAVYLASAEIRHSLNRQATIEPTGAETP
jgi:Catalase